MATFNRICAFMCMGVGLWTSNNDFLIMGLVLNVYAEQIDQRRSE